MSEANLLRLRARAISRIPPAPRAYRSAQASGPTPMSHGPQNEPESDSDFDDHEGKSPHFRAVTMLQLCIQSIVHPVWTLPPAKTCSNYPFQPQGCMP